VEVVTAARVGPTLPELLGQPEIKVSTAVLRIVGLSPKGDYASRSREVHKLTRRLPRADVETLYAMMRTPVAEQRLSAREFHALRNDLLDALVEQESLPEDLGRELLATVRDRAVDVVWRDYCVQHFVPYYTRKWSTPASTGLDDEREEILSTMWAASAERHNRIAGTAIMALERLSRDYPEVESSLVAETALSLAEDEQCDITSRMSATRLCGHMGMREALPAIRDMCRASDVSVLRRAAVATLADIGEEGDVVLLDALARDPAVDTRLSAASEAAGKRLRQRLDAAAGL